MTDRAHAAHAPRDGRRRLRFGALSAALLVAATASCVLFAALAQRSAVRWDVTATRAQSLAPRTRAILDRLDAPVEIVVVTDERRLDPRARRRIADVLDEFSQASALVTVTRIDPVTDAGRARFTALRQRVAGLYKEDTRARAQALASAARAADGLITNLSAFSDALLGARDAGKKTPAGSVDLENAAAVARLAARSLGSTVAAARDASAAEPPSPGALAKARTGLLPALTNAQSQSDALARALAGGPLADARQLAKTIRDDAARAADLLQRRPPSQANLVLRILESADAVLVLSKGSSTAIPFAALFPTTARLDEAGASAGELRFVGEELIATAIASLARPVTPIVVLTHTLPGRLLDSSGEPASPAARNALGAMMDRLALRGVSLAEWPVALDASRPALARQEENKGRPVVWFCFGTEGASADAAARFDAYARAVGALLRDGESVMISLAPSARPASGADDPIAAALAGIGIDADTARPIFRTLRLGAGDAYTLSVILHDADRSTPIGGAIDGLPIALTWLTPVRGAKGADVKTILRVPDDGSTWAEAEWRAHASAPDDRPWTSPTPPTPNARFDDVKGPWPVAVAFERDAGDPARPQRIVAVGSPGWFFNRLTDRTADVDGRSVALYPGNLGLVESGVFWAAGMDEMIAPGAVSLSVARIGPIPDAELALIRWGLILGLPLVTLLVGGILRLTLLR